MAQSKDIEVDLHVWIKPAGGTRQVNEMYTVSSGKKSICVDVSQEDAVQAIVSFLDQLENP